MSLPPSSLPGVLSCVPNGVSRKRRHFKPHGTRMSLIAIRKVSAREKAREVGKSGSQRNELHDFSLHDVRLKSQQCNGVSSPGGRIIQRRVVGLGLIETIYPKRPPSNPNATSPSSTNRGTGLHWQEGRRNTSVRRLSPCHLGCSVR